VGRRRSINEDDLAVVDLQDRRVFDPPEIESHPIAGKGLLLAVCDGVGGHRAGEIASELCLEVLVEEFEELSGPDCAPDEAFRKAVENVNARVWKKAGKDPKLHGMATTLTAVVVCPSNMIVAQVGDSRAYLLRKNTLTQLTRDQSFVETMVSSGALSEEEAKASPYRNMILQAIGREKKVDVALEQIAPEPGDVLLLCTDGLCGVVGSDAIARAMARPLLEEGVRELIGMANEAGGPDNITVLVARVDDPAVPGPGGEAEK
jgi:protein phosphatase